MDVKIETSYLNATDILVYWKPAQMLYRDIYSWPAKTITIGPLDVDNFVFPTVEDCVNYYYDDAVAYILTEVNLLSGNLYSAGERVYYDQPIDDAIKLKQDASASLAALAALSLSAGKMIVATGSSNLSNVDTTAFGRSLLNLTDGSALSKALAPTVNNAPGRSINTAFQISTTKAAWVNYTVQLAAALLVLSGQIDIQLSSNGTTFTTVGTFKNSGIPISTTISSQLQAYVPAGYYVKLVSSGGATPSYLSGQEIVMG